MNTFLSLSQQELKEQYLAFAKEHVAPIAKKLEESDNYVLFAGLLQKLAQLGWLGITVPKEHGGQGESFLNLCLLAESLGEFEPGLGLTLAEHTACIELINRFGNDVQKASYLPLLAAGEAIGTVAISEPTAGTDYEAVQSHVWRQENDLFLSGRKTWVVNGQLSSVIIVLARYAEKLSFWLVNLKPVPSLRVLPNRDKLGLRSSPTNDIEFTQHKIDVDALLGGEKTLAAEGANKQALLAMDVSKVIIAASAVGLMEGALAHAVEHAKTREQFGAPLSQFQAVQWKVSDFSTELSASRLMTYRAASCKDEDPNKFHKAAAMAKLFATKAARMHSGEALQIMGSWGVSTQAPMEKFYRDAKVMEICEGTSELQKMILTKELVI